MTALTLETTSYWLAAWQREVLANGGKGGRVMPYLGDTSRSVGISVDGPLPGFIFFPHKVAMPSKNWMHFKNYPGVEMLYNPLTYMLMWRCCWCHIPVHKSHCERDECLKKTWWYTVDKDWRHCYD